MGRHHEGRYNTDFEAANIGTVEFWMLDPFMSKADGPPLRREVSQYQSWGYFRRTSWKMVNSILKMDCLLLKMLPRRGILAWGRVPFVQAMWAHSNDRNLKATRSGFDGLRWWRKSAFSGLSTKLQGGLNQMHLIKSGMTPTMTIEFFNSDQYPTPIPIFNTLL